MLANERFVAKAPAEVVEAEREKLERYRRELAALDDAGLRRVAVLADVHGNATALEAVLDEVRAGGRRSSSSPAAT